jgi:hypothetical protein
MSSKAHRRNEGGRISRTYARWSSPKTFSNPAEISRRAAENSWACTPAVGRLGGVGVKTAVFGTAQLMGSADWEEWPGTFEKYPARETDEQVELTQKGNKRVIDVHGDDGRNFFNANHRKCIRDLATSAEHEAYRFLEKMRQVPEDIRGSDHPIPDVLALHDFHAMKQEGKTLALLGEDGGAKEAVTSSLFGAHRDQHAQPQSLVISVTVAVAVRGLPTGFYQHGQPSAVAYATPGAFACFESMAWHEAVGPHHEEAAHWSSSKLTFFFTAGRTSKTSSGSKFTARAAKLPKR